MNLLSSLYRVVTAARNNLFDRDVLRSRKLSRPVISVGNISVGGSGKTPFVIMLGDLLQQHGIVFDVLSRGYGRLTHGTMPVDRSGASRDFGDEPILIARRLNCPVIVGESRYQAGKLGETHSKQPQLHILDDGFQHRSLARDFDIVLLSRHDISDRLLPAGRLREPLSSLRRADAIAFTDEINPSDLPKDKNIWHVRRSLTVPSSPPNPIAFCGIARPERFIDQLQTLGIQPIVQKFYRDHHRYTQRDIQELLRLRDQNHAQTFITTEKDAINLGPHLSQLSPVIARVEMELLDPTKAINTILQVIDERRRKP